MIDIIKTEISKESMLSGIFKICSLLLSFLYVPMAMEYLGIEKYGIWTTILTILSWISYFDLGIGNGLRNRLTEAIALKKFDDAKQIVSSSYAIVCAIMSVVIICSALLIYRVDWNIVFGVKKIDENLAQIICLSVVIVAMNFVLSLCKNVLFALQRASIVSFMELAVQGINFFSVYILCKITSGSLLLLAIVYGASMLIVNIVVSLVIYGRTRYISPNIHCIQIKMGLNLTQLGIQFLIIQICALVLLTTDNLLVSVLYGATEVTSYSTVSKLYMVVVQIFTAFLAPLWSSVTKAKVQRQYLELKRNIYRIHMLMIPFAIGIVILIYIFKPLTYIWLQRSLNFQKGLIFVGALYCILNIWCNTYAYIANGLELMKASMTVAIVQACTNIPLSLYFAQGQHMKSTGILLGTVCSMMISAIIIPIFVYRYVSNDNRE